MRSIKLYILNFIFALIPFAMLAQSLPDNVLQSYNAVSTISDKGRVLTTYLKSIRQKQDFLARSQAISNYFKEKNDEPALDYIQLIVADNASRVGDYTNALKQSLQLLSRFENREDSFGMLTASKVVSLAYYYSGESEKSGVYEQRAIQLGLLLGDKSSLAATYNNVASGFVETNRLDSGLVYARLSVKYAKEVNDVVAMAVSLGTMGEAFLAKKEYDSALAYLREARNKESLDTVNSMWTVNDLAQLYLETNKLDSARYYASVAVTICREKGYKDQLQRAYKYLSDSYEKENKIDSAFKYYKLAADTKESLFNAQKAKQVQAIVFKEQKRQLEVEHEKALLKTRIWTYALIIGLIVFTVIAFVLYRNNRQKQQANKVLEQTLTSLKATQSQLIQSEKMASLGELTAGIAHEIQNPLNFVNNFSEVSNELIDELQSERLKAEAERDKEMENDILNDIKQNLEKINHHGKRADAIVKGMLQHSRASAGQKEPTDINALTDEYLRLSYHGLRAKDKSFNADMQTVFDNSIGKISVVPQDIGRVLLNLFTNAFYATSARRKTEGEGFKPLLVVATKRNNDTITIKVSDNGGGIPSAIIDKIFQPFFTTKPTGEGTGLGLSLSYDIIKAHHGKLSVQSREGVGTDFIIELPA